MAEEPEVPSLAREDPLGRGDSGVDPPDPRHRTRTRARRRSTGKDATFLLSGIAPAPRTEVAYNIEPFRGGLRKGDWKLVWRTPLPSALELYNIAQDPYEKTNLADKNPQKVAELQKRIEELAKESAKSLFLVDALAAVKSGAHGAPALPTEEGYFTQGD